MYVYDFWICRIPSIARAPAFIILAGRDDDEIRNNRFQDDIPVLCFRGNKYDGLVGLPGARIRRFVKDHSHRTSAVDTFARGIRSVPYGRREQRVVGVPCDRADLPCFVPVILQVYLQRDHFKYAKIIKIKKI